MDWNSQFRAAFFHYWVADGLPAPHEFESHYSAALRAIQYLPPPALPGPELPPLNKEIVHAVYAFGVQYAAACGVLLDIPRSKAASRARWCGRFNLGISLFDHACDERHRLRVVSNLPALRRLGRQLDNASADVVLDVSEQFLDALIDGLLDETTRRLEPVDAMALVGSLRRMLGAQIEVSSRGVGEFRSASQALAVLRLKSQEPFAVMASWIACASAGRTSPSERRFGRRLGRVLGRCYWLFDDAKDLWEDLSGGRTNYFLLRAAAHRPELMSRARDGIIDVAILRTLESAQIAHQAAQYAVRRVVTTVAASPAAPSARRRAMGMLGASLTRL